MSFDRFWTRPRALALATVMAAGLGALAVAGAEHLSSANPPASFRYASPDEAASRNTFAPVVKKVLPAVVNVSSAKMVKTQGMMPGNMDPFFRQFFGDENGVPFGRAPRQQREQGVGSGVIVSPEGYILTNNHVVDGATDVRVTLSDKREFKARIVGTDPKTDLAVLKIDASDLPSVVIGDSDKVQVGDYALAIGNPFGLGGTVTMGIISATGRGNLGIEDYEDFIQTDAPINPGNSGGALVNDRGDLIGINTAILAHGSEGNQGIGFAIPVSVARNVTDQILRNGKVTRAYLGVMSEGVTPALAKAFHESHVGGALVSEVSPNSPASHAGIEKGDIILSVNGKPVNDNAQLRMTISLMQPGTEVRLKLLRDGAEREVPARLEEMPTETAKAASQPDDSQTGMEGVSVEDVSARDARQLGLPPDTSGVVVTAVDPASQAAANGLQRGDVILEVNRKPVRNTAEFEQALKHSTAETLLLVNRQGSTLYLAV
ncbi:MAG: DegQ family serine endoprotease [Bryobacteraceae bacterium]|jgi:serine protease Do